MADIDLPVFSFLPNWERGITETLEWATDVLRSDISGHEQRRSVRLSPRRYFEARFNPFDDARSYMDLWLQRFGAQEFLLPLWHDRAKLTADADASDTRLAFDNTYREFEAGGLALLRRSLFVFEVVEIEAQDDTGLDLSTGLTGDWSSGSVVYPLRPAFLDNLQAVLSSLTRRVGQCSLAFRLSRENPYPLGDETLSLYEGFPVVTIEPNRRDDLETRFEQMYAEADFQLGRVYRRTETDRAFAAQFYDWQARGRQQHHELRQTLYRLNGRQKAIWIPSFNKDVVLARDIIPASVTASIQQIGYRYLGGPVAGRDRITLKDDSGTRRIVRVTGTNTPLAAGEDRLTLSAAAGFTASAGLEGSFMDLVRMDQDRVEIEHYTDSDGVCETSAAFRSFTQGRAAAGVLVQPYPVAVEDGDNCGGFPAEAEQSACVPVYVGWYARAVISLVGGNLVIPGSLIVAPGVNTPFSAGVGDQNDSQDRPLTRFSPDGRSATLYFYGARDTVIDEIYLTMQFPASTPLEQVTLTKVRFSFATWGENIDLTAGNTPKDESTIRAPGTPSTSTDNPMSIIRIFPCEWFF